jgi:hypothetical protein
VVESVSAIVEWRDVKPGLEGISLYLRLLEGMRISAS